MWDFLGPRLAHPGNNRASVHRALVENESPKRRASVEDRPDFEKIVDRGNRIEFAVYPPRDRTTVGSVTLPLFVLHNARVCNRPL